MQRTMQREIFTAVFEKLESGRFIGHIEEVNGVITQADSLEEAKETLVEALFAMKEVKDEIGEPLKDSNLIVEQITPF